MHFLNAKRGLRLVYISKIIAIAATLLSSGLVLLSWLLNVDVLDSADLPVVITALLAVMTSSLVIVVTAVTGLFGYLRASRDEAEFRKAMICTVLGGVLNFTGIFMLMPNGTLYTILNAAGSVAEMFVMFYAISGMIRLSEACGRQDLKNKGEILMKVLLYTYIISALDAVVIRIFELSAQAQLVSGIFGIVDTVLEVAQSLLILYYLHGVLKMLTE